jgi:multiple sugar transport system substrate-binding protein
MRRAILLAATLTSTLLGSLPASAEKLVVIWHKGTCADAFLDVARNYPAKGVEIVADLEDAPHWDQKIREELGRHGDAFDLVMWDSQSTAALAAAGHAVSINEVFATSKVLSADLFDPTSLLRYGE